MYSHLHLSSQSVFLLIKELREKIAVVPEDSPLFSGNLRQNLDINGKATDADLWKILEEVCLIKFSLNYAEK